MSLPAFPAELLAGVRNCLIEYGGCKKGDQVVILCELGPYLDPMVVEAQATVLQSVGAEPQIVWTRRLLNSWWEDLSPVVRGAIAAADVVVQNMDTIGKTHMLDLMVDRQVRRIRNYACDRATAGSAWARFPVEVQDVLETRINTWLMNTRTFRVTSAAGTDLQARAEAGDAPWRRWVKRSGGLNITFPPGIFRAVEVRDAEGVLAAESTYPWGARRVGLSELGFSRPVRLTVSGNRVIHFEGGWEAEAYRHLFEECAEVIGERAYVFDSWHTGTSPMAAAPFAAATDPDRYDHLIHNHEGWFHFHIGSLSDKKFRDSQRVAHVNAVVHHPTVYLDGEKFCENGRLLIWSDPELLRAAEPYGGAATLFAQRPIETFGAR